MRVNLIYLMLVISIISVTIAYGMNEQDQITKEVKFGENLICFVKGKNSNFFDCSKWNYLDSLEIEKKNNREDFCISLSDVKMTIGSNKKLKITGNKRKRDILVQNPLGEIILDLSNKKQKKDVQSLDEKEVVDDSELQLLPGSSITLGPCYDNPDSSAIEKITFDEARSLESKEGLILPVVGSCWEQSQLVKVAINQPQRTNDGGRIFLDDTISEIILLDKFLVCKNAEERKKLVMGLSIIEHVTLLSLLNKHCLAKEFDLNCNYFGEAKCLLEEKINNSLKKAVETVVNFSQFKEWFKKINTLPLKEREIVEDILRKVSKVLYEWYMPNAISNLRCNFNGMKGVIFYLNDKIEVVELSNGNVLLSKNNLKWIFLNEDGTKAEIEYLDDKIEIVDLASEKILFCDENIVFSYLNPDFTIGVFDYFDGRIKVIDLQRKEIIFVLDDLDIEDIRVDVGLGRIFCYYGNGKIEIINLKNGEVLLKDNNIVDMGLGKDRSIIFTIDENSNGKIIDRKNGKEILNQANVKFIKFLLKGKRAIVYHNEDTIALINLEEKNANKRLMLTRDNACDYGYKVSKKFIGISYNKNDAVEVIDVKSGDQLFIGINIEKFCIDADNRVIAAKYKSGELEISFLSKNKKNRKVIFKEKNIKNFFLDKIDRVLIWYKNGKIVMHDLEDNQDILTKLTPEELIFRYMLKRSSGTRSICQKIQHRKLS